MPKVSAVRLPGSDNPRPGDTLTCGHVLQAEAPGSVTTGYGRDSNGGTHCYECCTGKDLDAMDTDGRIVAYLSEDGRTISNWPGRELAKVTREWEVSAGGFAANTKITRVWARDRHGNLWHGRGPGRGMYLTLRRSFDKRNRGGQ